MRRFLLAAALVAGFAAALADTAAANGHSPTPEYIETLLNREARLIEDAALLYAAGPSLLWMGQGFQRQSFGGNAMRASAGVSALVRTFNLRRASAQTISAAKSPVSSGRSIGTRPR